MKKLLFLISVLVLLTSCGPLGEKPEEPALQASPDGIQVDHGTVFGMVHFIDENSVEFYTDLDDTGLNGTLNSYKFSEDAVIKVLRDGNLAELPLKNAMSIGLSSSTADYYFYFVINGDQEVLQMTQANVLAETADQNSDDLVYITGVSYGAGSDVVTVDPIRMLSCAEAGKGDSCPNGYVIENKQVESIQYLIPLDKTVFSVIDWGTSIAPDYPMNFVDFEKKFSENKVAFETTPYHLQTDGYKVVSLIEKYLP
ncbi:MAG: hypothetical protein WC846_01050 [Candidatus Gracilibacteria bacterium]|jgi:hypothetical protein